MRKKKIGVFDADVVIYRIGFKCQEAIKFNDDCTVLVAEDLDVAKAQAKSMVLDIFDSVYLDDFRVVLSGQGNFRKELCATYKAPRKENQKPVHFAALRKYLIDEFNAIVIDGIEADDTCGILATGNQKESFDIVVISEDKDLLQIPGDNYNPRTKVYTEVSPEDGYRFHMWQTLVGDRVDNYPGCPGIGEAKASRILSNAPNGDLWGAVVQTYQSKGLTEEDALLQARLSCILHAHMYDKNTKQISLFQPKQRC